MTPSQSYAERHEIAAETFRRFNPGSDTERTATGFAARLGALGSMAFDVVGAMWSRPQLSRRDRSLMVISVLAAQARQDELEAHTRFGIGHGLTRSEVEEILLHVAAYAGFPAAMAASRRIDAALRTVEGVERLSDRKAAARKSDAERDRDAAALFKTVSGGRGGDDPAKDVALMESMLGEVGVIAYRWAFGEIWCRPELSRRDRSLAVIAILVSLGATPELAVHVPTGLAHGLSRTEIEEIINHMALYCGIPRAVEAMRTAREAFAKSDGT
ncbi:MAG: carboxymuconolactone decarboxylase family protein [Alphaproteobacteria bacterium]|nr:carboxymuconolactone decarboxylase family protein [Alphaproteobacteria bacterium]